MFVSILVKNGIIFPPGAILFNTNYKIKGKGKLNYYSFPPLRQGWAI